MTKLLIYSHDTYGLGNTRRMLAIATHVAEQHSDVSILLVSGSPMLHAFRIQRRMDYIKLPCLSRDLLGNYQPRYLNQDCDQLVRLRSGILECACMNFKPDLVLVDKKPRGVRGEFSDSLEYVRKHLPNTRCVLLLRDILDASERTASIWHRRDYFKDIEIYYDKVLVVGMQKVFDVCKEYRFPLEASARVQYCGYLARSPGQVSREETRDHLQVGEQRLVLAMAGGGEDGFRLLDTFFKSLLEVHVGPSFKALVILGSEMPASQRQELQNQADHIPNARTLDFSDDIMSLIDASDLVVSMAGYNTVCECLTLNKPVLVVPRTEPSLEQWLRAERMHDLGVLNALHPDAATPFVMRQEIDKMLAPQVSEFSKARLNMEGLENVTKSLFAPPNIGKCIEWPKALAVGT